MPEDTSATETILKPILNFCEKYGRDRFTHDEVKHLGITMVDLLRLHRLNVIERAGVSGHSQIWRVI